MLKNKTFHIITKYFHIVLSHNNINITSNISHYNNICESDIVTLHLTYEHFTL